MVNHKRKKPENVLYKKGSLAETLPGHVVQDPIDFDDQDLDFVVRNKIRIDQPNLVVVV